MSAKTVEPTKPTDHVPFLETLGTTDAAVRRHVWRVAVPVMLAACTAVILLVFGLSRLFRDQSEADAWVNHTLTVLERTALLEGNLANAVAEGRGFLLDPTPDRRSRVEFGLAAARDDVAALTVLTSDNPVQQDAIAQLAPLIDARVAALHDIMQRATSSELPEVARIFRTSAAMPVAVRIHQTIIGMRDEERRLLSERGGIAKGASRNILIALIGCGLLASVCMGVVVVVLLRRRQEQALHPAFNLNRTDMALHPYSNN